MENQIYPCLWFDDQAKKAATFYTSVFRDTRITGENQFVTTFVLSGQKFMCLNGGPLFRPDPSISFFVVCESHDELEYIWQLLLAGGNVLMALDKYEWSEKYGWIQDKFGISWQLSYNKMQDAGQKVTPVLMFTNEYAGKAEEAIKFYTTVFDHSSLERITRYGDNDGDRKGYVKNAGFRLGGQAFMAMDSSLPHSFKFSEGISLVVECQTQDEIDYYWSRLSAIPEAEQCGWLKDKYGLSWQIVPEILSELLKDPSRSERVTRAFMQMKKFEIEKLVNA